MLRRKYGMAADSSRAMLRPLMRICPRVGRSAQKMRRKSVDLPAPDGPVRKTNSPFGMSSVRSTSAWASAAYDLYTWKSWIKDPSQRRPRSPVKRLRLGHRPQHLHERIEARLARRLDVIL